MEDFKKLFNSFTSLKVVVIGDLMLDTYMWGKVDRISPEAPVPVVLIDKKEYRIGGAGNVALNCKSLGAQVTVLSILGNDGEGKFLEQLLQDTGLDTSGLIKSDKRITTSKTRVISRNQQMMRLDTEITTTITDDEANALLSKLRAFIAASKPDVIIFEDYNKGVLTPALISEVIALCKANGIVTAVDPKKKNFFSYKGADIFKPNLKEVKEALNLLVDDIGLRQLGSIHGELEKMLQHRISFITLSEKGVFYQQDGDAMIIPSHIRNVADVSGAGDTVIAVAALVYAATKNVRLMAEVANIAGGVVCEEVGTVAISKEKLLQECELLLG
ncbi:MAG: bifunctional ADP-heptose synthase [Chitinophagaceae bacterium]